MLTDPVVTQLRARFPDAHLAMMVGERARQVFAGDPRVDALITMDEFTGGLGRLRLAWLVWRMHPDVLVDLRHTALPLVWKPWRIWRYVWPVPPTITHMRVRHLWRLRWQVPEVRDAADQPDGFGRWLRPEEVASIEQLASRWGLRQGQRLIVICPGARSHIKRWSAEGFAAVADRLIHEADAEVVFAGEPDEAPLINDIRAAMHRPAHSAAGHTTIRQLAALMQRARLVITNDSAALHVAGAVGTPILAIFGPTDPRKYGPTGARDRVIQRQLFCVPCEQALCRFHHECMRFISPEEVYRAAEQILEGEGSRVKGPTHH